MTPTRQVVVAYDFSEHGQAVLDRAIALASRAPFHALHFVCVLDPKNGIAGIPPKGHVDYQYADTVRDELTERITRAFGGVESVADITFFIHTRIGTPATEILGLAKEVGADLIFIGTHGYTGLKHFMLGSVAEHVVREAQCPVMVVRPKGYPDVTLDTIVEVPSHGTPHSRFRGFTYTKTQTVIRPPYWSTT